MSFEIAALLLQDGLVNGAIYALVALGLVIVFAVTRVIFVSFGDLVALTALTQAALQDRRLPGTVWLLLTMSILTTVTEFVRLSRLGDTRGAWRSALAHLVLPALPIAAALLAAGRPLPVLAQLALATSLVVPMGPLLYRTVFRPIATASVLRLLIVAVALHFSLSGMMLIFFGPEGVRTQAILQGGFTLAGVFVTSQSLLVLGSTLMLGAVLFWFFDHTLTGRALRATAINRVAARLVGIRPAAAGSLAFTLSSALACVSGILIGPIATLYYDSGFLIGLKAFVGAITGGLTSYPLSILGALFVGMLESFASFWNSGLKEIIVFSLLIPVLLLRSWLSRGAADEEDEEETAFVSLRVIKKPVLCLAAAGLVAAPFVLGNYGLTLLNFIGLGSLVSLGLVLLTGISGLTSFGQAAFVGLGAYATAWATTAAGLSPWTGGVLALMLAGGVAAGLGAITLRLGGHFLPLSTIAWGMGLYFLFGKLAVLGGYNGISDIPPLSLGIGAASSPRTIYVAIWVAVGLAILLCDNLLDSRLGRAMRALKGGAEMVQSFGIDAFKIRLAVFVIAGLLAGASGWLYAHMQQYVGPSPFEIRPGAEYLLMAVTGGSGQVIGAVVGSAAVLGIKSALQDILPLFMTGSGQLETVAFGVLFILLLQYARDGVAPVLARLLPARAAAISTEPLPNRMRCRSQPRRGQTLLIVESVTKRFGGLTAVDDMRFSLGAGEILGLIGPNGAGKTTMFNLITGSEAPDAGKIRFGGTDITGLAGHRIASEGIARTFQHVRLRPQTTLLDNVALGAFRRGHAGYAACALRLDRAEEAHIRNEALTQLERVGLRDKAQELAGNLALGQQRLVEIARALAADPLLMILDEPAAGLRKLEKKVLAQLLREISGEGITILLVEHDMEFVMGLVDRLVVMNFGQKLAEGVPADIQADAAVQKAYLGALQ